MPYTYEDRWNRIYSRDMMRVYLTYYTPGEPKKNLEVSARIHNGGPDGWRDDPQWFVRNRGYTVAEAIDKTLGDLQSRAELDIVNEVVARYTDLMEPIKPPLSTAEGERLRSEMLKLKKSVAECRGKVHSADAMKRLDELSTAIDNVLTQLEG